MFDQIRTITAHRSRRGFIAAVGVGACLAVSAGALAAGFPERPVRIVVPFTPGAAADIAVRLLQPLLQERLGQPVVIDYKSGAGGALAFQEVVRAVPDGHTILMGPTNNFVIDPYIRPGQGIDPLVALTPIVKVAEVPAVLFVSKDLGVKDWAGFKAKATAPQARLNYGSPGNGTTPHLSMVLLGKTINAPMTHIPYRGSQPVILALLANEVQAYMGLYQPLAQFVERDRIRAIAVVADQRLAALPNVPTVAEAGVPPVLANNWFALAAPAKTPPAVVAQLAREIQAILKRPEVRAKFEAQGFAVSGVAGDALKADLQKEAARWRELIVSEGLAEKP